MLALIGNIYYSVFRKEGEFMKVEEDVFSYSVKKIKGHDDVIPCIRERCFDYVFSNNNKFIALFLNEVLSLDSVINESDIVKLSNNMEVKHKKDKYHRLDFVYKIDKLKLNIELNLKPKAIKERNIGYLCSLFLSNIKSGSKYEVGYKTIQVNVNMENVVDSDKIVDAYYFTREDGKVYSRCIGFYTINLANYRKVCYTKEEEAIRLRDKYRILLCFTEGRASKIEEVCKDSDIIMEILRRQKEFSDDSTEWKTYRDEFTKEEELQLDKELACKESFQDGFEDGVKQGFDDGAKQIAKNLLSQNIDIDIIMKSTGLSLEEINLLRS